MMSILSDQEILERCRHGNMIVVSGEASFSSYKRMYGIAAEYDVGVTSGSVVVDNLFTYHFTVTNSFDSVNLIRVFETLTETDTVTQTMTITQTEIVIGFISGLGYQIGHFLITEYTLRIPIGI